MGNKPAELRGLLLKIGVRLHSKKNKKDDFRLLGVSHPKLQSWVAQFQACQEVSRYGLDSTDILIIGSAWYQFIIERTLQFDPIELLSSVFPKRECIHQIDRLVALLKKNVFYTQKKRILNVGSNSSTRVHYDMYRLLENDICFHRSFTRVLMNETEKVHQDSVSPYGSNKEFVADWFSYVNQLAEFSYYGFNDRRFDAELSEGAANDYLKAMEWKQRIEQRLEKTKEIFPLQDLVDEYQLDHNETVILMYLVKEEIGGTVTSTDEVLDLISRDQHEKFANKRYIATDAKLIRHGLIELTENFFFRSHGSEIRVSPDITRQIIMNSTGNDDERLQQIIKGENTFTLLEPTHDLKDLIVPAAMKKTIKTALARYESKVDRTLSSWGLFDGETSIVGQVKKQLEPGLLMLFYGPPGTGKTFAAGTIAKALNKKLLVTDISRIQSKWVGESEKNIRRMFTIFERIIRRTDNPPVLLLNEADQFLSRRLESTDTSVDVMYNSMQNLFLEAFERLKGIMIATTNLRENLDTAFSRRFHLKLEFPLPGVMERMKLWKLHLPATIPGSENIDIPFLSRTYALTGGQISIIVKNAATEAASRYGKQRKLTLDDLVKYCEIEQDSMFDRKHQSIGFQF